MDAEIEFNRTDILAQLNQRGSLSEKMQAIRAAASSCCDFIHRISVAIYDPKLDLLKTLAHSTDDGNPLPGYQTRLSDTPSLKRIFLSGKPRIINDLSVLIESEQTHETDRGSRLPVELHHPHVRERATFRLHILQFTTAQCAA